MHRIREVSIKRLRLSALAAGLICLATPGLATTLVFDNMGLANYGSITNYGSNMTGPSTGSGQAGSAQQGNGFTPNVAVMFRTLDALGNGNVAVANTDFRDTGYGDLLNVAFPAANGNFAEVTLSSQTGWFVKLNSFDLAGYGGDQANQSIRVYNADYSQVLFAYDGTIHGGATHDSFPNLNITSLAAIHIQFGPSWNIGIDNIDFDQIAVGGAFQLKYFNTNYASGQILLSNAGSLGLGSAQDDSAGTICANVYAFDPNEEMTACCSCQITPNGLASLSILDDVVAKNMNIDVVNAITVKLLFTRGHWNATGTVFCDPAQPTAADLSPGGLAWGTNPRAVTFQGSPPVPVNALTETPFSAAELSGAELSKLTTYCQYVRILGSKVKGICGACQAGARGGIGR